MNVCQLQCDTRLNRCPNRTPHVPGLVESVLCQPSQAETAQSCNGPLAMPKACTPLPAGAAKAAGLAPVPAAAAKVMSATAQKLPAPKATRIEKFEGMEMDEDAAIEAFENDYVLY